MTADETPSAALKVSLSFLPLGLESKVTFPLYIPYIYICIYIYIYKIQSVDCRDNRRVDSDGCWG